MLISQLMYFWCWKILIQWDEVLSYNYRLMLVCYKPYKNSVEIFTKGTQRNASKCQMTVDSVNGDFIMINLWEEKTQSFYETRFHNMRPGFKKQNRCRVNRGSWKNTSQQCTCSYRKYTSNTHVWKWWYWHWTSVYCSRDTGTSFFVS